MHAQRSHIINHITKGIYLLLVLLFVMLCTNAKAQENDTGKIQNTANGIIRPDYTFNFVIPQNPGFVYDSISGNLIVYDYSTTPPTEAGRQKLNEDGKPVFPMTVKDQAGNVYQLTEETDENGNTTIKSEYLGKQGTPLTSDNFDASKIDSDKAIVSFEKGAGQYAFDKFDIKFSGSVRIRDKYTKIGDYNVPWKFLPESGSDKIQAKVMLVDNSVNPENVMFQTPQGMLYEKKHLEGNTFEISAVAGVDNDVQQIYALYPTDNGKFLNLGRVDVVTYKPQTAKLVAVSVNGNTTSTNELKAYLNDVYGKVGVTFEVETDTFTYNNAISFFDRSSGWFSRYTAAMKAFNIAYRENIGERYDSDKNYLFILGEDSSRSDRDAQGFMPLGGRFGYLFKNQIPDNQINSIAAHELGHGIWALKHTFDNDYGNIAVNTTDNLMDYTPQANHLAKWQWEIIRYPALFTDPFGGDEEGMVYSIEEIRTLFETIRTSNNKLTPGIANVPIIVRFQDIVDDIHFADSASNLATDFSKEEFLASFTHEQSLKLADTLKDRVVDTSSNLPTDYNPIILANKAKITIGGKTYKVTLNGYAMTEQIYTTHIADDIINEEHRLIFFNANRITSKEKNAYKTNTNLTEVKNIRKSFEIIVHDSIGYGTSEDLKQYLKIKGVFDLSRTPTLTDGLIVLKLRRLYSTDFITIGELTADGDSSVQLVTVELRKTENCAENNSILPKNEKSRVCAGTYDFELNTQEYSTAPQHRYKSLRLHTLGTSTGGLRDGILVHTGWDYSFTDGCILTLNVRDVENVINNPQDFLNSITTGKIKNISEEPISHETIITFEKERKATKEGQQIELKGVTGYTGYNDTFTIVRRIDDKTIIINKQFHQEANVNSATFKIFTTGDYLVGSNWNYSAPATISLYEYVEKYVPDGVVKGRIIITEIGENINITPQFVQQSYINVLDYLLEIIEDSMN